jgi:predicted O-methyltransferase YrrM
LPVLWGLARMAENGRYGEVGFKNGSSALALCIAARETNGKVYSIDIDECPEGRARIESEGYGDIHTFIHGDSAAVDFPEPLDILFIDGSHDYHDVKADYERHAPSVRKGGMILFHDPISWPPVGKFLDEAKVPYWRCGSGLGLEVVE